MAENKVYPIGVQSFTKIIEDGLIYVDKTEYVRRLVKNGTYYFLSRPRRFGKSLLVSTLEAYFQGKRDLFKGLALDADDMDWTPRPVFLFSFNNCESKSQDDIFNLINSTLIFYEEIYGRQENIDGLSQRFEWLLINAYRQTGQKVAVLIDEYDSPLLDTLNNPELNEFYRNTLKAFYTVLKTADRYISFALITGVSRFTHTSLFSGANNLEDISIAEEYAAICGITEEELKHSLKFGIESCANKWGVTFDMALNILKENYDGYHFCAESPDIYNPYSLIRALKQHKISNYWFASGTPSYLIHTLPDTDFYIPNLDGVESVESDLGVTESYTKDPVSLMFETGYLTIKAYDPETGLYTLGMPNLEVGTSLTNALLPAYSGLDSMKIKGLTAHMRKALANGEPYEFIKYLKTFLHGNPYSNSELAKRERYFKSNLFLVLKSLGFSPVAEEETCNARMDLKMETRKYIYIFELKIDKDAKEAMEQIEDRDYAAPYRHQGKKIIKIALSYSSEINNISDAECKIE